MLSLFAVKQAGRQLTGLSCRHELGHHPVAGLEPFGAARMEGTAGGDVERVRRLAAEAGIGYAEAGFREMFEERIANLDPPTGS